MGHILRRYTGSAWELVTSLMFENGLLPVPEGYIAISTPEDLDNVRNDPTANYMLNANIDLTGWGDWQPLPSFSGIFDGNGYIIKGMHVDRSADAGYCGLFETLNGALVQNLGLLDVYIKNGYKNDSATDYKGMLCGTTLGGVLISKVYARGEVDFGTSRTGALVGYLSNTVVKESYAEVLFTGYSNGTYRMGFIGGTGGDFKIFEDCYYNDLPAGLQISTLSLIGHIEPEAMASMATFEKWNKVFWGIQNGAPALKTPYPEIAEGRLPVKDTSTYQASGDVNYATSTQLKISGYSPYRMASFLEFDISDIPQGSTINSATLVLYKQYINTEGDHTTFASHRITESWSEETLTYNNQPGYDPTQYDGPFTFGIMPYFTNYHNIDMTQMLQEWVDGTHPNLGVTLHHIDESYRYNAAWHSSKAADETLRPRLYIDYT